jgi:hypothetical protein
MTTLNDIKGQDRVCWRFIDADAPDHKPTANHTDGGDKSPSNWDGWRIETGAPSDYLQRHGHQNIELLEHYSTHREPTPRTLRRGDLKPGDCYQYLDDAGGPHIVEGHDISFAGMPPKWLVSTEGSARLRMESPVRRIPHWNDGPVILPCVDPLKGLRDAIFVLEESTNGGIKGRECLTRFERGQQTESIAHDGTGYVCTNAECGLTSPQIELAQMLWSSKLRLKVAEQAAKDAERERTCVVVDYVDG